MTDTALTLRALLSGDEPSISPVGRSRLAALVSAGKQGDLIALAREHRVAPWLSTAVSSDPGFVREDWVEELRQAGAEQTLSTLGRYAELAQLVTLLNERGIGIVVLKGPAVARQLYPDQGLRPYGDIDILIEQADLPAVSRILFERGYRERHGHDDGACARLHPEHGIFQRVFFHAEEGHVVEVHCDHLQIGMEPVGMKDIRARAEAQRFGQGEAATLEKHDLFLHLCVHLQRHGFNRLIWFKDLDLLIRRIPLDWSRIGDDARRQGCLGSVTYTLWLLERMLGAPLPKGARALAQRESRLSRFAQRWAWPPSAVLRLQPARPTNLRRAIQFAPEEGWIRGALPSFLFMGRRSDKLRVLAAAVSRRMPSGVRR